MLCSGAYLYLSPSLSSVEILRDIRLQTPMRVYTRDGALIGQFGEQKRNPLTYDRIPPQFVQALLAAEDDGFFEHAGIDLFSLGRAATELLVRGEIGTGGSTLTMQVARNYFLSLERTFIRKFKEMLLSLQIERTLSKEEILELYCNQVFLGHRAYGFEAAAQVYYGSHISDLNLPQWAMLAGLPKAPSRYNPLSNPERALVRRDWILGRMRKLGHIDEQAYQEALNSPVTAAHHGAKLAFDAPYAAEMARAETIRRYGLAAYNDGYHVFTTIDSRLQRAASQAVLDGLAAYDERHGYRGPEQRLPPVEGEDMSDFWRSTLAQTPTIAGRVPAIVTAVRDDALDIMFADGESASLAWENGLRQARPYIDEDRRGPRPRQASELWSAGDLIRVSGERGGELRLSQVPAAQAALISLDASNGAILSVVGGLGFERSKFNRAIQAERQPGSSFKPFIYAAAMENGFTAASIINDAPVVFEDASIEEVWRPENDGGKFYGPTRLRWALTKSRNLVSIRLLQQLGTRTAINYATRFGFDSRQLSANLSLALGTHSVTPRQLAVAFASLANGGYKVEPWLVERVEDFNRQEILRARPATVCHACERRVAEELAPEGEELSMEEILAQGNEQTPPPAGRIMDPRVAFVIDSILRDVITQGTGRRARALGRSDIAGKTGTTNGPTDAWFAGYNPDVVATAWLGFDENLPLGRIEFGGTAALPIWMDFMRVALEDVPIRGREIPEGMVHVRIDPDTGLLARPGQPGAIFEYFPAELVPQRAGAGGRTSAGAAELSVREQLF